MVTARLKTQQTVQSILRFKQSIKPLKHTTVTANKSTQPTNNISGTVNKISDVEAQTREVGNQIADLDDKLAIVMTHTPSRDRQTARRIHQRNALTS